MHNILRSSKTRWLLLFLGLISCLLVITRYEIYNGFTILPGDRYDVVIMATLLEHWYRVLKGLSSWLEVGYFFPHTKTIAQTDAYFLLGLIYAPLRSFGFDPFIAIHQTSLIVKAIGFFGAYFFCRRVLAFSFFIALLAAVLFTISNSITQHSQRLQLATVAFTPVLGLMLFEMWSAFNVGNLRQFRLYGVASGIFYGAWCLTCFYMAWFFLFFTSVFLLVSLCRLNRDEWQQLKNQILQSFSSVLMVLGAAILSIAPFAYAFLLKSFEVGVRPYHAALANTISIFNVLQVGFENFTVGRWYNAVLRRLFPRYVPDGEYYNTGVPIILFMLFVCACIYCYKNRSVLRDHPLYRLLSTMIIATIVTWIATLHILGLSFWFFIYHLFPGAKALNVIAVYQMFLVLPVIVIACWYLQTRRLSKVTLSVLSVCLIAEEFNRPYINLHRQDELARITLVGEIPDDCRVFYVSGWHGQETISGFSELSNNLYAHNVSAM